MSLGPGFVYGEDAYGLGIYSLEPIQGWEDEIIVPPVWLPAGCQEVAWEVKAPPAPSNWSASGCQPLDTRRAS